MATDYKNIIDWDAAPALEAETFTQSFEYDAMNRLTKTNLPDGSWSKPGYNKAGLLENMKMHKPGDPDSVIYVTNINYNEKGQRTEIYFGNNSKTKYEYHEKTFRLIRLLTTRHSGAETLQDLEYTYDPVGNITRIYDSALDVYYYNNSQITPEGTYEYDALYRLKTATGRELNSLSMPGYEDFANDLGIPYDGSKMRNYEQQYQYDELGNILQMKSVGQWTRDYYYTSGGNQLTGHAQGGMNTYYYDAHGNTIQMPHLSEILWDYKDQLKEVDLGGGGTAYYVYDASGKRVRKIIEKPGGIVEERLYLGGYEVFRRTNNGTLEVERKSIFVEDGTKTIAQIDDDGTTQTIRYQYDNHLGSASLELDETGDIISYEEYHPFGTTSFRSGRSLTEVSLKRYKYVGKERDNETGLYYYGARYYADWIGRFVSVDAKAGKYLQLTPYHYTSNNPVTFLDFDGNDFGVKVNHKDRTIVIHANINTYTDQGYKDMNKAVAKWNSLKVKLENGYTVSYELTVTPPKYSDSEIRDERKNVMEKVKEESGRKAGKIAGREKEAAMILENRESALEATKSSNVDNLYLRNQVPDFEYAIEFTKVEKAYDPYIKKVTYKNGMATSTGGFTFNHKYVTMAIWRDEKLENEDRNQADNPPAVWHEIGHLFGLNDKGKGIYYADKTIMDYSFLSFSKNKDTENIGEIETQLILNYAKEHNNVPVEEINKSGDKVEFRKMDFNIK